MGRFLILLFSGLVAYSKYTYATYLRLPTAGCEVSTAGCCCATGDHISCTSQLSSLSAFKQSPGSLVAGNGVDLP